MKNFDTEAELSFSERPFNKRMFTQAHIEAVREKVGVGYGRTRRSLSASLFTIATVLLLVIFLQQANPFAQLGTITDKLTPTEAPNVEIQENTLLVDYYLDGMARNNLDYISEAHGRLVIDPGFYEKKRPERGDVVYFRMPDYNISPGQSPLETNVARVVALPGESVEIIDGQVYINGKKLDTFYGKASMWGADEKRYFEIQNKPGTGECLEECTKGMKQYFHMDMKKVQVPEDGLFVMGDTWARSIDSQTFGPLSIDNVRGKVLGYEGKPSPSPIFQSGNYRMQGVKGKLGIIAEPFKVGAANKYMWHFWGTKAALTGSLKVEAVEVISGQKKPALMLYGNLVWEYPSGPGIGALNGADASLPSTLMLGSPGIWRLDAFIGGHFFGSIFVEVN
jgi:signal peptidase I